MNAQLLEGELEEHLEEELEISFVLPCLNEAQTIEGCIEQCRRALESSGVTGEIVVADNGSSDGSQEIAQEAGARVITVAEKGYGTALLAGFRAAHGKYILMGDSDLSYDFSEMPRFLKTLKQGHDLVMGCRMPRGGGTIYRGAMPFSHRWVGNPILSGLGRLLFQSSVIDFHCGIRAFEKRKLLSLNLLAPGMEFASEMVVKAHLANLKVAQVPVTLRPDGRSRRPHLRTWRDGWRHLRFMLLYSPRWLFMYPGSVLLLLSLAAFILLMPEPRAIGHTKFDTNSLLVAGIGLSSGFQVLLLGLFIEIYARSSGLLPRNRLVGVICKGNPFEIGIVLGIALFVLGLGYLCFALRTWEHANFGDLSYPDSLRLVIPGVVALCLSVQVFFGGFVVAVLGLGQVHRR